MLRLVLGRLRVCITQEYGWHSVSVGWYRVKPLWACCLYASRHSSSQQNPAGVIGKP